MEKELYQRYSKLFFDNERTFARLGLVLLATDPTTESDFTAMYRDQRLLVHATRIDYNNPLTPSSLQALEAGLKQAMLLLVPGVPLDAVYFSCTSGSALLGNETVTRLVQDVRPNVPVFTPLTAAYWSFKALDITKLSILVPYTRSVAGPIIKHFSACGIQVTNVSYLDLDDDWLMARLSADTIVAAARTALCPEADALFISCTTVQSARLSGHIEKIIERPVITSNQAAAWYAANVLTLIPPGREYGSLMDLPLPDQPSTTPTQ